MTFSNYILFSCSDLHEGLHGEDRENIKIKSISENIRRTSPEASAFDLPSLASGLEACLRDLLY